MSEHHHLQPQFDLELKKIAKRINERELEIDILKTRTIESARITCAEAVLQGQDLIEAQARLPKILWNNWLRSHCPKTHVMAARYMKVATRAGLIEGRNESQEIQTTLALLFSPHSYDTEEETQPKRWPAYLEGLNFVGKLRKTLKYNPFTTWPNEGREKLIDEIRAIGKDVGFQVVVEGGGQV